MPRKRRCQRFSTAMSSYAGLRLSATSWHGRSLKLAVILQHGSNGEAVVRPSIHMKDVTAHARTRNDRFKSRGFRDMARHYSSSVLFCGSLYNKYCRCLDAFPPTPFGSLSYVGVP